MHTQINATPAEFTILLRSGKNWIHSGQEPFPTETEARTWARQNYKRIWTVKPTTEAPAIAEEVIENLADAAQAFYTPTDTAPEPETCAEPHTTLTAEQIAKTIAEDRTLRSYVRAIARRGLAYQVEDHAQIEEETLRIERLLKSLIKRYPDLTPYTMATE